jgi:hypothetical protein
VILIQIAAPFRAVMFLAIAIALLRVRLIAAARTMAMTGKRIGG